MSKNLYDQTPNWCMVGSGKSAFNDSRLKPVRVPTLRWGKSTEDSQRYNKLWELQIQIKMDVVQVYVILLDP